MKEYRTEDFLVTIVDETRQHETVPERYEGIYSVQCNHRVEVTFVPDFQTEANWPPTVAFAESIDWDSPPDVAAARWTIVMTSDIVVTPHDGALHVERVTTPKLFLQDDPRSVVMLCIPRELFSRLVDEIRMLLDATASVHSQRRILRPAPCASLRRAVHREEPTSLVVMTAVLLLQIGRRASRGEVRSLIPWLRRSLQRRAPAQRGRVVVAQARRPTARQCCSRPARRRAACSGSSGARSRE